MSIHKLFSSPLQVVNVGIESFKENCEKASAAAIQVDWRPPVEVAPESEAILAKRAAKIEKANRRSWRSSWPARPNSSGSTSPAT